METEAIRVQEEYLLRKFQRNVTKYIKSNFIDKIDYILIIGLSNYAFIKMFINCSKKVFKNKHFTIIINDNLEDASDEICGENIEVKNINDYNNNTISEITYNKYNLTFVLSDSYSKKEFEGYRPILNNLECQVLYSDYNCEIYKSLRNKRLKYFFNKLKFNKQKYFRKPSSFIYDIVKLFKGEISI